MSIVTKKNRSIKGFDFVSIKKRPAIRRSFWMIMFLFCTVYVIRYLLNGSISSHRSFIEGEYETI